jgi:hypothetical protein
MDGVDYTGNWMIHNIQDPTFQLIWKLFYGYDVKLPEVNPYTAYGINGSYAQINNPNGPAGDVVDWVLVEIWGNINNSSREYDLVESRALLLKPDGTIRDTLNRKPQFNPYSTTNIRIVVKHRNHAAVISMDLLPFVSGTIQYDFTVVQSNTPVNAYNLGNTRPEGVRFGVACLWAGDYNMDGRIDHNDMTIFNSDFAVGRMGAYLHSDVTMDAYTNTQDASFINENVAYGRFSTSYYFLKRP